MPAETNTYQVTVNYKKEEWQNPTENISNKRDQQENGLCKMLKIEPQRNVYKRLKRVTNAEIQKKLGDILLGLGFKPNGEYTLNITDYSDSSIIITVRSPEGKLTKIELFEEYNYGWQTYINKFQNNASDNNYNYYETYKCDFSNSEEKGPTITLNIISSEYVYKRGIHIKNSNSELTITFNTHKSKYTLIIKSKTRQPDGSMFDFTNQEDKKAIIDIMRRISFPLDFYNRTCEIRQKLNEIVTSGGIPEYENCLLSAYVCFGAHPSELTHATDASIYPNKIIIDDAKIPSTIEIRSTDGTDLEIMRIHNLINGIYKKILNPTSTSKVKVVQRKANNTNAQQVSQNTSNIPPIQGTSNNDESINRKQNYLIRVKSVPTERNRLKRRRTSNRIYDNHN